MIETENTPVVKRTRKPRTPKTQIEQATEQFDQFDKDVKELTFDRLNETKKQDVAPQTELSQKQIANATDVFLKPKKSIGVRDKFNEKFREEWNHAKEYVKFIAENREIIGDNIEIWTRPFAGIPAEYWEVPTNKPIWGPRYLAEQIKRKYYHRLTMQEQVTHGDHTGQYYGKLVADTTVQRLDAIPVSNRKSVFLGANSF